MGKVEEQLSGEQREGTYSSLDDKTQEESLEQGVLGSSSFIIIFETELGGIKRGYGKWWSGGIRTGK